MTTVERAPREVDEASAGPSPAGVRAENLAWRLLPLLVFALLTLITWKRWILPFQDSGREMLTAARLASGEVLYRDVGSPYGPFPAHFDALALRIFGKDLDVLIGVRILIGLLGVEALRRLAIRLAADTRVGSAVTAFIVAACAFGTGGAYPFPYSVAALEGTVGMWWAVELALASRGWRSSLFAALIAGVAAGTKMEMLPPAVAGLGAALFAKRPKREAVTAVALATLLGGTAFIVPILLFGREVLHRYGYLIAFPLPKEFRFLYERHVLFPGTTRTVFLGGGFSDDWAPAILLFGAALLLCSLPVRRAVRLSALALLVLIVPGAFGGNTDIHGLLPASAVIFLGEAFLFSRRRFSAGDPRVDRLCIAIPAMAALVRQPFFLRNVIYGAFSSPLPLAISLGWIASQAKFRRSFAVFLLGLTALRVDVKWQDVKSHPWSWLEVPRASLYVPQEEARFLRESFDYLSRVTPRDSYLAILPDPGFLLFTMDRRSPFVDDVFAPGSQDRGAEDAMIRRLQEVPVAAVVITNREFSEFGHMKYGQGVLDRFLGEVGLRFRPAVTIGAPPRERWSERHVTMGVVYLPKGP